MSANNAAIVEACRLAYTGFDKNQREPLLGFLASDTYWLWPHRDDRIQSNLQAYGIASKLADVVGRPVATPAEYRRMIGA